MRKISLFLVAAMLLSVSTVSANEGENKKSAKKLSVQIYDLLSYNSLTSNEVDQTAFACLTLNENREIVVLSVDAANEVVEAFVKESLHNQKVSVNEYKEGRSYTLPVRIDG
ncbi:hypothetical protein [Zobellia alginiliquefaciens]|uniref:hypothetical protein n=1 Tax=Zobellia alginiliquefaciens TaxID=3032586 RepID=UPI0023E432E3|nr:hypothetical protein [Zobellia alginiliquefaciens]